MKEKGFTLIEILVVVAIVGLLSSIVLASINTTRIRARDAERLSDVAQIVNALELYYSENGQYPPVEQAETDDSGTDCSDTGNTSWGQLRTELASYIDLPCDPLGPHFTYAYRYESDPDDENQTYGLMVALESESNFSKVNNDNGYYNGLDGFYYEVGQQPSYCISNYSGSNALWFDPVDTVCRGGN